MARIAVVTCDGGGTGSGFLVAPDTVMTAAHVVEGATTVSLRFGAEVFAGEPVLMDTENDLALVRVDGQPAGHRFAIAEEPAVVGEDVAILGYPEGRPLGMTQGAVTSVDLRINAEDRDLRGVFRTDSAINPGNSGGPVLNKSGDVVGVVSAGSDGPGDGYAVSQPRIAAVVAAQADSAVVPPAEECEASGEERWDDPVQVSVTSTHPEAPSIAQTLQLYGQALNERYNDLVWYLLTPSMHERVGDYDTYFEGLSTSSWISVDVLEVEVLDEVTDEATVALRTTQTAEYGPDGATCSDWVITYTLVLDAGEWQIDGARLADGPPLPCPDEESVEDL
ncbi:trypsin-like peptidase domain-containing protein [Cellulomonas fimi]|uniref:Trypsin-like peptidase domain-containing protein n=1 Tax=Cellulomonas fimi TaxID=1708 RepID=A0A7Y0LWU7_CELFI|nr:trypsin-like peptidase domain-containing protein [Cellulomonas fimi]NMR18823.1 trypsin-like peptidase domain-containing protein [Cellulomonas fimi]